MSRTKPCACPERREQVDGTKARPGRLWRVLEAYFSGSSELRCIRCGARWVSRAACTGHLPMAGALPYPKPGTEAHAVMMRQYGRAGFERVPT